MSTEIFYFTSTGNSLVVARELAARTDGTLTSIPSVMGAERIRSDADAIGIVFPVYYASLGGSGIPLVVERFLAKLEDVGPKYVFAVCTHSGGPGDTIENLERIVRAKGGELAAGLAVRTGVPYGAGDKIRYALLHQELTMDRTADDETRQALFAACTPKLDALGRQVRTRERGEVERRSALSRAIGEPWLRFQKRLAIARYQMLSGSSGASLDEMIPLADASFETDERCAGCGICARICPVGNIQMVNDRPAWQHHCETCYACFQWCPRKAIRGSIVEYEKRDHHPKVNLAAMLKQTSRPETPRRQND